MMNYISRFYKLSKKNPKYSLVLLLILFSFILGIPSIITRQKNSNYVKDSGKDTSSEWRKLRNNSNQMRSQGELWDNMTP